jgi:Na+-translocating ferredoxin:NAD+ oxidoreductase RNF subunit RnfB
VEVDPRLERIEEILPGLNCGGCGYPGCPGFAEGLLTGDAEVTDCAPGGEEMVAQLADFLGLEVGGVVRKIAVLKCGGGAGKAAVEALYEGVEDCRAAVLLGGGGKSCRYSCVGYGTCEKVCPFDAIAMNADGLPDVDPEKCTACNKCVVACPRDVLVLEPADHQVIIRCSSPDPGPSVKKVCSVGCTGCGICEKVCPVDAALLDGSLAAIVPETCVDCGICAAKCPTGAITDGLLPRSTTVISDVCNGCTICSKVCPYDAIMGQAKELHVVDHQKCTGCGLCIPRCPVEAIAQTGPVAITEG